MYSFSDPLEIIGLNDISGVHVPYLKKVYVFAILVTL